MIVRVGAVMDHNGPTPTEGASMKTKRQFVSWLLLTVSAVFAAVVLLPMPFTLVTGFDVVAAVVFAWLSEHVSTYESPPLEEALGPEPIVVLHAPLSGLQRAQTPSFMRLEREAALRARQATAKHQRPLVSSW